LHFHGFAHKLPTASVHNNIGGLVHLHHDYIDAPREFNIVDAQTAADRWVGSAGTAQSRYTEGIQATTVDPTALAVAQQAKLLQNFTASVQNGRWSRGLQRVGGAGWKAAAVAKASNFGTGFQAGRQKYLDAIGPVLQVEAQLQQQISSMPNVTIQDAINRSAAWQMGLHQWAQSR
jgi:hypothetical protein